MKVYVTLAVDVPTDPNADEQGIASAVLDEATFTVTWEDEQNQTNELSTSVLSYSFTPPN